MGRIWDATLPAHATLGNGVFPATQRLSLGSGTREAPAGLDRGFS